MPRVSVLVLSLGLVALALADAPAAPRSMAGEQERSERGMLNRIVPALARAGRQLNRALAAEMREAARGGVQTLVGLAVIAFVCGLVQAAGPGHGKIVLASVFLTGDIGGKSAVGVAGLVSVLQVISAVSAVVLVGPLLAEGRSGAIRAAAAIEWASYALAVLIAAVGTALALAGHGRAGAGRDRRGVPAARWGILLALGLTPSASAVNLGVIAVGSGTLPTGAVAALAMAAGAGVTLAIVAVAGIAVRSGLARLAGMGAASARDRAIAVLGWLVATAASAAFLWSAWTRVP